MAASMKLTKFEDVDLSDPFFDSLKAGYEEFPAWFAKKANEGQPVYVYQSDAGTLMGFLYLKIEEGTVEDVSPHLPSARWVKVGTMKIVAHGTKLGERFIKKIFDFSISNKADGIYVTVFEEHSSLIRLLKRYNFQQHSTKTTPNGVELVFVRDLRIFTGDSRKDYPFIHSGGKQAHILAIYPEYHTRLFPDSILNSETSDIVDDLSYTNAIHKVYICSMNVGKMKTGDILVMYRTSDKKGPAYYRSVVTSICVIEEVKSKKDFPTVGDFIKYALPHSVFSKDELRDWYGSSKRLHVIRMSYNAAFGRRTTRGKLIDEVGLSSTARWDTFKITKEQFLKITAMGEIHESLIVD
ncbi:MAG: N-acetyltransferase [Caulobacter sp.]